MVICQPYNQELKKVWDQFIDTCKTPLFFFKRDFLEYHADRFVDASLMFYIDNVLVGVFPATQHDDLLSSHGGLTYGGLLLSEKARAETVIHIVQCLAQYAWNAGFRKIIYKAIPYLFYKHGAQEDLYALFQGLDARIVRRDLSSVIYLDNRMALSKGRKWLIARAKKMGLMVTASTDWEAFHALLSTVLARHGVSPVHSVEELALLSARFPDNIQLNVVESEGELLAAALLFKFKPGVVHSQYLATSEKGKEVGALDFLLEHCIDESKQAGNKFFSFGISTEEQGTILNSGLIAQKENFGARGVVIDFYGIELNGQFSGFKSSE